jgi:hypothetical protein
MRGNQPGATVHELVHPPTLELLVKRVRRLRVADCCTGSLSGTSCCVNCTCHAGQETDEGCCVNTFTTNNTTVPG